jgi:hypothetical protein
MSRRDRRVSGSHRERRSGFLPEHDVMPLTPG